MRYWPSDLPRVARSALQRGSGRLGFPRSGRSHACPHACSRPGSRRASAPSTIRAQRPPARPRPARSAHRRARDRRGDSRPGRVLHRPRRAVRRDPARHGARPLFGLWDDIRGLRPRPRCSASSRSRSFPWCGTASASSASPCRSSARSASADTLAVVITIIWIAALANLVNLIDGWTRSRPGIVSIAAVSFALLGACRSGARRGRARRRRLRRDARVPAPQLPPGADHHGRHGLARPRLPPRVRGRPGSAEDGGHRSPSPCRCSCSPCRSWTRRSSSLKRLKYGRPPLGGRPEPLLPPLHAHRLLAAAHCGVPAPLGRAALGVGDPRSASCRRGRAANGI